MQQQQQHNKRRRRTVAPLFTCVSCVHSLGKRNEKQDNQDVCVVYAFRGERGRRRRRGGGRRERVGGRTENNFSHRRPSKEAVQIPWLSFKSLSFLALSPFHPSTRSSSTSTFLPLPSSPHPLPILSTTPSPPSLSPQSSIPFPLLTNPPLIPLSLIALVFIAFKSLLI